MQPTPMTLNELRTALQSILKAEESADVDWKKVEAQCRQIRSRLQQLGAPDYTDDIVAVFLDDAELRRADREYAQVQRERLRNWLEGSEILAR